MQRSWLVVSIVLAAAACSQQTLLGEDIWTDGRLAQSHVGFGWNYTTEGSIPSFRNVDVELKPDDTYEIRINEYRADNELNALSKREGQLDSELARQLRRNLAQLRSSETAELFATLPNCPVSDHPLIEFYVGFKETEDPAVTVIERECDTPETVKARQIVRDAFDAFPQLDRARLRAGLVEL